MIEQRVKEEMAKQNSRPEVESRDRSSWRKGSSSHSKSRTKSYLFISLASYSAHVYTKFIDSSCGFQRTTL